MKRLVLSQGKVALVDDSDFEWLNQWKWSYRAKYASRRQSGPRKPHITIYMHRVINNTPHGFDTDHINRDRLDNRRINLRTATRSENNLNKGRRVDNLSGYTGVTWRKDARKWIAQLNINRKHIYLGRYESLEDALNARKSAERKYFR